MKIIYLFIIFSIFISCQKDIETKTIFKELQAFKDIELNSFFDVYLTQDTTYSIKVIADESIADKITFIVEDSILKIDNENTWKWMKPNRNKVKLYITSNQPHRIFANETCNIQTINPIISKEIGLIMASKLNNANLALQCSVFYFINNHPTGGKVTLSGQTNRLKVWSTALIEIDAKDLISEVALIVNNSKGDCSVKVTDILDCTITGTGNVISYGKPNIVKLVKNSGTGILIENQ